jgi:hypothetical protein
MMISDKDLAAAGAEYGRAARAAVERAAPAKLLLSNSGRCAVADLVAENIRDEARLRRRLKDERAIAIFEEAARAEFDWLGI